MSDITLRALEVLRQVDTIFAEDTRDTRRLLAHHGVVTPLAALHEHNERDATRAIQRLLASGKQAALVTDAGTPGIADPGAIAVAAVRAAGFDVVPIPGPNAAIAALSVAGFSGPHAFIGFLPAQPAARRKALENWRTFPHTLVLYEAPHRILESVDDLARMLGVDRPAVIARELTKVFETVHACVLGDARAWLEADADRQRGEFVIVVAGAANRDDDTMAEGERVLGLLAEALPVKTAVQLAASITGAPRNALYRKALAIRGRPQRAGRKPSA